MSYQEENQLMSAWLDLAQELFNCGAEVKRVERSLILLAQSQGATSISTFSINSTMNMTCTFPDGNIVTQTRRIVETPSFDLKRFEEINSVSRQCCKNHAGADEIHKALSEIKNDTRLNKYYAGAVIVGFAFSLFFGGQWYDGLVSGIMGGLVCLLSRKLGKYLPNTIFFNFFIAFFLGIIVGIICKLLPLLSQDKILIGDIMLLIPGLAITGSMRDMLVGDIISGATRFIESILWAGALAVGFIAAFLVTGGLA